MKVCVEVSVAPDNPNAPTVTEREVVEISPWTVQEFLRKGVVNQRMQIFLEAAIPEMVKNAIREGAFYR